MDASDSRSSDRPAIESVRELQHELRSPLNAVLGLSQLLLLRRSSSSPEQHDWLEQIHLAGTHMLGLIESMEKSWGAGDHRESVVADLRCDIRRGVLEATRLLSLSAALQGVEIQTEIEPEGPLIVPGNETMHRQIFVNLLSNAIKFGASGGRATITVRCPPELAGFVEILVRDDGCGMSPDDLARLFEPHSRVGANRQERSGSGLGLHLVLGLVGRLGGAIRVDSVVDAGTTFSVRLPLKPAATPCAEGDVPSDEACAGVA
jgi:two-component system, sensor histidine kinase and response regulator